MRLIIEFDSFFFNDDWLYYVSLKIKVRAWLTKNSRLLYHVSNNYIAKLVPEIVTCSNRQKSKTHFYVPAILSFSL